MIYAPIIVFAFNRLNNIQQAIHALQACPEAPMSDLYVFVDGARKDKKGEQEAVEEVQKYVQTITGFKQTIYTFADSNKGLGPSIISGVSSVMQTHRKAIVVEDDLCVLPNFLSFMNQALNKYEAETQVFSICGYTNKIRIPRGYASDAYFCVRSSSWGWATWADRWDSVNWQLEPFSQYLVEKHNFNAWGGSDCWHMLNEWHEGGNKSWAIRFCFAQYLQKKVSLFPVKSLVKNNGFDGNGTNCKSWSRFKYELADSTKNDFIWPESISIHSALYKSAMKYHTIAIRLYSRLMYLVHQ